MIACSRLAPRRWLRQIPRAAWLLSRAVGTSAAAIYATIENDVEAIFGDSIAFAAGHYAPQTEKGRRLLAHELAHTIQQSPGRTARTILQRTPDPISADQDFSAKKDQIRDTLLQSKKSELFALFLDNLQDTMKKSGKVPLWFEVDPAEGPAAV